jgi:hypothetical protein
MTRTQMLFGGMAALLLIIVVLGVIAGASAWKMLCPAALIALGGAVIARHVIAPQEGPWDFKLIGDVRLAGPSLAESREIWVGIGDIRLDLSETDLPDGEIVYQLIGLIGDVEMRVPGGVGLIVDSSGLITDAKIFEEKHGGIFAPIHYVTPDYESAASRVRLDAAHLIGDLKVKRA